MVQGLTGHLPLAYGLSAAHGFVTMGQTTHPHLRTPQMLHIVGLAHLVLKSNTITIITQAGHYCCIVRPVHGSVSFALSTVSKGVQAAFLSPSTSPLHFPGE